ncbi:MAG: sigma-70 family RNA polymerase sigma factor [Lewinellaceae bacterium]|nr:sigma-70 family RNA polymerase sigma factor [Lewinellaceae bacterium]
MELELATRQRDSKITGWFAQYGKRVLAYVRSKIRDLEAAEDAAQDVWLQLTRQDDLDEIEQVGNWLFTTARNRVTDYYRKKKNVPFSQVGFQTDAREEPGEDVAGEILFERWLEQNLPDALLETQEFWEELDQALEQLPAEQRDVFVANELYDVPFREISEQTGVSVNTLLSRKRYAVLHLRRHFEQWKND